MSNRTRIAREVVGLVVALCVAVCSAVVAVPSSASGMEVDCSFSAGMKDWLDGGGAPGVSCARSRPGGAAGSGGGGTGSGGAPAASESCVPDRTSVPSWFWVGIDQADATTWSERFLGSSTETTSTAGVRRNYVGGKLRSELAIFVTTGRFAQYSVVYTLWSAGWAHHVTYSSMQRCGAAMKFSSSAAKDGAPDRPVEYGIPISPIGVLTPPEEGELRSNGGLVAAAGSDDHYLLRLDLTNISATQDTPAFVSLGTGFSFDFGSVAAVPGGTTCSSVAGRAEECAVSTIPPGQTRSLILAVSAKAGVSADAVLPITVSSVAARAVPVDDPAHPALKATGLVSNVYFATRPAAATPSAVVTAPVCAVEGTLGIPDATPAHPQEVVAGLPTKLRARCTISSGFTAGATTAGGAAAIDRYGWVTVTAPAASRGAATVSVVATDPATGGRSSATLIEFTVVAPPVAVDDAVLVTRAGTSPAGSSVMANDSFPVDGGWGVQLAATPPAHGVLELDPTTGGFVFTPDPDFVGVDSVRYRLVGPGGAASGVATVTFTVG